MFRLSNNKEIKTAFFGSSEFSVIVLRELKQLGLTPDLVISTPDTAAGRGLKMVDSPLKQFCLKNNLKILQPQFFKEILEQSNDIDLFLVASYGKIIPKKILDLAKYGTLNIHP